MAKKRPAPEPPDPASRKDEPFDPAPSKSKATKSAARKRAPVARAATPKKAPAKPAPENVSRARKIPAASKPSGPRAASRRKPAAAGEAPAPATVPETSEPLHIVMVASEAHPFATSGGLAEVVGTLPFALGRLGHRTTIVIPRYRRVVAHTGASGHGSTIDVETTLTLGPRQFDVAFHRYTMSEHVTAVFVDIPELFDRDGLYGSDHEDYPDNALRFAAFSRAALECLRLRGQRPSVIHAHDWQTGLLPAYQKMLFSDDPVVGRVPVVFTVHNLAFQGIYPASTLPEIGLPWDVLDVRAMEFWGRISYLKSGINFSERITTVSPSYAKEVLSQELGSGLEGVLGRRAENFTGILNGIDTVRWNPASDAYLPASYTADDLSGKAECKRFLLRTAGLPHAAEALDRPLIGLVSRLTDQKGFDIIARAAERLMALDAAWVMLGSGQQDYEEQWRALAAAYPDRVSATIGYDERLEHLIEAGADLFLMPSRFEPCGLNQLNSLRYGTLPIVRATGGLNDTVADVDDGSRGTGFKFTDYTPDALVATVERALRLYRKSREWKKIQQNAMGQDYSWDVSAREYVKVYTVS
jgi:starch synthase